MNEASYCQFCRKYGIRPLCFDQDDRTLQLPYTFLDCDDKSFLSQYSYTIRQDSPLTEEERRSLLTMLMENGLDRAADIRNHMEWLLNLNKTKPGFGKARCRWNQDLASVNEYIEEHCAISTNLKGRVVMKQGCNILFWLAERHLAVFIKTEGTAPQFNSSGGERIEQSGYEISHP